MGTTDVKARIASLPPPAQCDDGAAQGHVVQFYQDETLFLNELSRYIGTALVAGEPAIVIATKAHRDQLATRLRERGLDLSRAAKHGRYSAVDAAELQSKIMVNGRPDAARFNAVVGSMIAGMASAEGNPLPRVAIFGEMVALLWAEGKGEAALQLEQLWKELGRAYSFSLRCAYPTSAFLRLDDGEAFLKICDAHSGVIPDESYTKLSGDEERLRKIAELQQAAQASAELARLNEHLRQSEERFRLLVESVKDYAIFMLSPEGKILSWNAGAEKIKGYRAQEIIGQHFSRFYAPEDVRSGRPERGLKVAAAEGRYEDEGWRVRKDGSRFWANVVITAVCDAAGNLRGFSKVTRDISERRESEETIRQLSGRLLQAHDQERRRLGRELHDSTTQTVAAISINIALLSECADFLGNPKASRVFAELKELTDQAARELRSVAYLLHPPMLDDAGLRCALDWYVDGFVQRTKIQVDLEVEPRLDGLSKELEIALFRVVQESLTNVYRHSGSSTAKVRLALESGEIILEVSDRGKGFPANSRGGRKGAPVAAGVGISGMGERMHQFGGRLEVTPGNVGIIVKAVVPLNAPREASVTPQPVNEVFRNSYAG